MCMIRRAGSVARIREATNSTSKGHEKCIQNCSWHAWRERELGYPAAGRKILYQKIFETMAHTAFDTANWQVLVNQRFCRNLGTSWTAQRPAAAYRETKSVRTINHNSTLTKGLPQPVQRNYVLVQWHIKAVPQSIQTRHEWHVSNIWSRNGVYSTPPIIWR